MCAADYITAVNDTGGSVRELLYEGSTVCWQIARPDVLGFSAVLCLCTVNDFVPLLKRLINGYMIKRNMKTEMFHKLELWLALYK